jgi:hypothetical protein
MNETERNEILETLQESFAMPDHRHVQTAVVDYYVETPRGSKTRFQRNVSLSQIMGARSETAVFYYLRRIHPKCDIQIQNLEFR